MQAWYLYILISDVPPNTKVFTGLWQIRPETNPQIQWLDHQINRGKRCDIQAHLPIIQYVATVSANKEALLGFYQNNVGVFTCRRPQKPNNKIILDTFLENSLYLACRCIVKYIKIIFKFYPVCRLRDMDKSQGSISINFHMLISKIHVISS